MSSVCGVIAFGSGTFFGPSPVRYLVVVGLFAIFSLAPLFSVCYWEAKPTCKLFSCSLACS